MLGDENYLLKSFQKMQIIVNKIISENGARYRKNIYWKSKEIT